MRCHTISLTLVPQSTCLVWITTMQKYFCIHIELFKLLGAILRETVWGRSWVQMPPGGLAWLGLSTYFVWFSDDLVSVLVLLIWILICFVFVDLDFVDIIFCWICFLVWLSFWLFGFCCFDCVQKLKQQCIAGPWASSKCCCQALPPFPQVILLTRLVKQYLLFKCSLTRVYWKRFIKSSLTRIFCNLGCWTAVETLHVECR